MFGENDAQKARQYAEHMRQLDAEGIQIQSIDDDAEFHRRNSEFLQQRYAPMYEEVTDWFRTAIAPVRESAVEAMSADIPEELGDVGDMSAWGLIVETAQKCGPDFEFDELITSPEEWEQDGYPDGMLTEVAKQLERLGTNPFSDEQRRSMRVYAEELRKRADLIAKLAEGSPLT